MEKALAAALKRSPDRPRQGRRARRLRPAARLRPARRARAGSSGRPSSGTTPRPSARPRRSSPRSAAPKDGHRPARHRPGRRLHRLEDPLAQEARAAELRQAGDRPSPPQLSELLADGPGPHGVRRRLGHGAHGHPPAPLGRGGRRPPSTRISPRKLPAAQPPARARADR